MIRVTPAPKPTGFDAHVRQPGLRAIAERVGKTPTPPRAQGEKACERWMSKGKPPVPIDHEEDLPSEAFPSYWTDPWTSGAPPPNSGLDHLLAAYQRICAYSSLYIEWVTGAPSVDHMAPKSKDWRQTYEWTNYRLACQLLNARKRAFTDVLDPFEVEDGWFELELVGYQIKPRAGLPKTVRKQIRDTIARLGLNEYDLKEARGGYVANYKAKHISLTHLERRAPFIARELRRQGKLLSADQSPPPPATPPATGP